jgi:cytochrome c553
VILQRQDDLPGISQSVATRILIDLNVPARERWFSFPRSGANHWRISMRPSLLAAAALAAMASLTFVSGASAQVDVRNLANSCGVCHGTDGKPPKNGLERLAGMNRSEFINEMHELRNKPKNTHLMGYVALGFSDLEIS